RLQPVARAGAHPGEAAGDQLGRRRAQSARAWRTRSRDQAREERPRAADSRAREDDRPRHHFARTVLEEGSRGTTEAMRRFACAALLAAASFLAWGQPSLSGAEEVALRDTIEASRYAFRRDDAQRAFSIAAPGIRAQFGTAENFMEMVRTAYAVVYRPRSVNFEEFEIVDNEIFQPVRLTDAQGQAWLTAHSMCRRTARRLR